MHICLYAPDAFKVEWYISIDRDCWTACFIRTYGVAAMFGKQKTSGMDVEVKIQIVKLAFKTIMTKII